MTTPACPKCGKSMKEGFVLDKTDGGVGQATWTEGRPQRSFWTGVKVAKDARHPIATFRCPKCGYLESYAHPS